VTRLRQILPAAAIAILIGGCGTTAVQGHPVAAHGQSRPAPRSTSRTVPPLTSQEPSSPAPTSDESSTPPPTTSESTPVPPDAEPIAVVQAYFDAINAHDYRRAWDLGGKNVGQSYDSFAAGFATTDHDILAIQSTQGNMVVADLTAVQTDGTTRNFHGTYTVVNGVITHFSVRAS
jgi:hypothetical protein